MTPQQLASAGYHLFPVSAEIPAGEKSRRPLAKWRTASTTDPGTLARWEKRFPGCWWGIDCGKSRLFVVDDDRGKHPGAAASLDALEMTHGELPVTFVVATKSGGRHHYFRGAGRNSASGALGPGLDTRGDGGYVVAPCCPGYSVISDSPVADAPPWLLSLVGEPREREERGVPAFDLDTPAALARAAAYLATAEPAIDGEGGGYKTIALACQIRDFGVSEEACVDLMFESEWNSKCVPEWPFEELEAKVGNAYRYAHRGVPGSDDPRLVFDEYVEPPPPPAAERKMSLFAEANDLLSREIKINYLVRGLVETPTTGLIFGDPSAGKSFLAVGMAYSVACGSPWMGAVTSPGVAVYFAGEGRHGIQRRLAALVAHHGVVVPKNGLWVSEQRIEFSPRALKGAAEELKAIEARAGRPISLVIVDTLARHMPAASDENSARDAGAFINACDWLRDQFKCVTAVVHHSGKLAKDSSRGSSAIRGAMDWEVRVESKKGTRAAIFTKQKESELPPPIGFTLEQVDVGNDVHSAVAIPCKYDPDAREVTLGPDAALALSVLEVVLREKGAAMISREDWRKAYAVQLGESISRASKSMKFTRAEKALFAAGLLAIEDGMIGLREKEEA